MKGNAKSAAVLLELEALGYIEFTEDREQMKLTEKGHELVHFHIFSDQQWPENVVSGAYDSYAKHSQEQSFHEITGGYEIYHGRYPNEYDVAVVADYAYAADFVSGLQVLSISDPTNPDSVGSFDTHDRAIDVASAGDYVCRIARLER